MPGPPVTPASALPYADSGPHAQGTYGMEDSVLSEVSQGSTLLAIDAGQTGAKTRLMRADGSALDTTLPGIFTDRPLAPQLAAIMHTVCSAQQVTPDTVTFGVSGLTDSAAEAAALLRDPALAGVGRVVVTHDSVTSFLGVLGDQHGAVVAAGTGVVTLGVGPEHSTRIDGWGYIMGDAGSGYWLGREVLDAVMRAFDGRGPDTGLTAVVQERWPDLASGYVELQASDDRVRTVASFAASAAILAAAGDRVAVRICCEAARELALSTVTALDVVAARADAAVGAVGGVFGSELIRSEFEQAVSAKRPAARFAPPLGSGLDGAVALAGLGPRHPLAERFTSLSR